MSSFEQLYIVLMFLSVLVAVYAAATRGARCPFSRNGHMSKLSARCARFAQKNNRPRSGKLSGYF